MNDSGVFKVYPDPIYHATVFEFHPPPVKMSISWISLEQVVTPEAMSQALAKQMLQMYRELLVEKWQEYFLQHYMGKEGLVIPATTPQFLWQEHVASWKASETMTPWGFEQFLQASFKKNTKDTASLFTEDPSIDSVLEEGIPGFHQMVEWCPVSNCVQQKVNPAYLRDTIIHLNDEHKWPRESIAEWLDTLDHDLRFKVPGGGEEDGSDH